MSSGVNGHLYLHFISRSFSLLYFEWYLSFFPLCVQEQKEQAAVGLGELIRRTSPDALKPSVVNITGPLIRILGDRFNFTVKVAVLETLALLLSKVRHDGRKKRIRWNNKYLYINWYPLLDLRLKAPNDNKIHYPKLSHIRRPHVFVWEI